MVRPGLALAGTATLLAALDLAHKTTAGTHDFHPRSAGYVTFVLALSVVWTAAILLTRSTALAVGGGVLAGGAIGNVVSLAFWPGVPNPFEIGALEFNLADAFVLAGFVLVAAVTLALVTRIPEELRQPVRVRSRTTERRQI